MRQFNLLACPALPGNVIKRSHCSSLFSFRFLPTFARRHITIVAALSASSAPDADIDIGQHTPKRLSADAAAAVQKHSRMPTASVFGLQQDQATGILMMSTICPPDKMKYPGAKMPDIPLKLCWICALVFQCFVIGDRDESTASAPAKCKKNCMEEKHQQRGVVHSLAKW